MSAFVRSLGVAVVALSTALMGCADDSGDGPGSSYGGNPGGSSSGGSISTSSSGGSGQPMLVDVDPNRTMSASPGEGVGVFTQYTSGGHWNVWWTCDTAKTNLSCSFDVTISVASGTITNAVGQHLEESDLVTSPSGTQLEATTTTTTGIDGMTFDTFATDGSIPVITLTAKLNGEEDGSFLFFVQDGAIDGNYAGTLTDPLMLEPTSY